MLHFLHGNGFCGRAYEPMLRQLAASFDLWLCDAQGHGDSDHGGRFVGWNRNGELAVEALKAQGTAFRQVTAYAAGHSFGGVLTALILGAHPGQFARAVLLDPVLFTPAMIMGMCMAEISGMARHSPMARQARERRRLWADRDEAFASLAGRGVYKGWSDEALRAFVDHALKDDAEGCVSLKCEPEREADVFSSAPERLWNALGRVKTPTLVLHAQDTYGFVSESALQWARINPQVRAIQVAGGHCFMQEHPQHAAERITRFLLALPGPESDDQG